MADAGPSSVELMLRIARSDPDAFASFYDRWFERALALARSLTRRDESFCMDVVQDTMLQVIRKPPAPASEAALAQWLARAIVHRTIDRLRAERRRRKREERAARSERGEPTADGSLAEQNGWLAAALADLPERDRALLQARYHEDLTLADAGARLGMTANAAHGRIRRALHRLRHASPWRTDDDDD